jgi:hypothetical protein
LGALLLLAALAAAALMLSWYYPLGSGGDHHGSPAYFGSSVSYLDGSNPRDSQLWACDHNPDGWRNRAEAQMDGSGEDIFVRDPDGVGGSCGRKDTSRNWDKHRMWGKDDVNPGNWSNH